MYPQIENKPLEIDNLGRAYLLETVRWTKFMAILGFIGMGLTLFTGLLLIILMPFGTLPGNETVLNTGLARGLVYLIFPAVYFYPVYALMKFSGKMKIAINSNSQAHLNDGLRYQKSMYKYVGIFTIIAIIFCILFIVLGAMVLMSRSGS